MEFTFAVMYFQLTGHTFATVGLEDSDSTSVPKKTNTADDKNQGKNQDNSRARHNLLAYL